MKHKKQKKYIHVLSHGDHINIYMSIAGVVAICLFLSIFCPYFVHIVFYSTFFQYAVAAQNSQIKMINASYFLFIQNVYSALFTNKRALMRYLIIKSVTKSYYSEIKNIYE